MEKTFSLSVVIPTIVRGDILYKTVDNAVEVLREFDFPWEIIVVNDSKKKDVSFPYKEVEVVKNPEKGTGSARNTGAKKAKYEYLLFLDDDILITQESIEFIREFFKEKPLSSVSTNWRYPDDLVKEIEKTPLGRFKIKYKYNCYEGWVPNLSWDKKGVIEIDEFASFFWAIKRDIFWKLGGFLNLPVMADVEFSEKLKKHGIKMFLNTDIFVFHNERDRQNIYHWYNRLMQGARDGRILYEKTSLDRFFVPEYSPVKKLILKSLSSNRKLFLWMLDNWINIKILDKVFFRLAEIMTALAVYEGYFTDKQSTYGKN